VEQLRRHDQRQRLTAHRALHARNHVEGLAGREVPLEGHRHLARALVGPDDGKRLGLHHAGAPAGVLPGATATAGAGAAPRAALQAAGRAALTEPYASYTIQKGDSLERIAQRLLNDRSRWREIAELNRLKNQDRLVPGTTIRVPKQST